MSKSVAISCSLWVCFLGLIWLYFGHYEPALICFVVAALCGALALVEALMGEDDINIEKEPPQNKYKALKEIIDSISPRAVFIGPPPIEEIEILEGLSDYLIQLTFWIRWDLRRNFSIIYRFPKTSWFNKTLEGYFNKILRTENDK